MSVWVDLDGVLADFDGGFARAFGVDPASTGDEGLWRLIDSRDGFFASLPPVDGSAAFFASVRELSSRAGRDGPRVLTACPVGPLRARVIAEKRRWVAKLIDASVEVVASDFGGCKSRHMRSTGEILIDDWRPNIEGWRASGGVGLLWRGHAGALIALSDALRSLAEQ